MFSRLLRKYRKLAKTNQITQADLDRGVIDVEINNPTIGFFAHINWCLYIFAYARANAVVPRIALTSENYLRQATKGDWFADYFQYIGPVHDDQRHGKRPHPKKIHDFSEIGFRISPDLTLEEAHDIFFAFARVQPWIDEQIDAFVTASFTGNAMLGVHYRGTDKHIEAPKVGFEQFYRGISGLLDTGTFSGLFVASDEQRFIDFLGQKITTTPIVVRDDSFRSVDDQPIHGQRRTANEIGLDAISNCILLSRCHSVLRNSSFLSAWASIFNPKLQVHMLNRPYESALWYPERQIIKQANFVSETAP